MRTGHRQEAALDRARLLLRLDVVEREEDGGRDEAADGAGDGLGRRLERLPLLRRHPDARLSDSSAQCVASNTYA